MKKFYIIFIIVAIAAGAFWRVSAQIMPPLPPGPQPPMPPVGFCGDKICNNNENNTSCPGDCLPGSGNSGINLGCKGSSANNWTPGVPDGFCDTSFPPEDSFTCPGDCPVGSPPVSGGHEPNNYGCLASAANSYKAEPDGTCDYQGGESYMNCVSDCGAGLESGPVCNGNSICEPYLGESWFMDGKECGDCVVKPICNENGVCEGYCAGDTCNKAVTGKFAIENPSNCPKDCGCPPEESLCNYDGVCDLAIELQSSKCADCYEPYTYLYSAGLGQVEVHKYGCDYDGVCENYNRSENRPPENQMTCADCIFPKFSDGKCEKGEEFRKSYDCKKDPCNKDGKCNHWIAGNGQSMPTDMGEGWEGWPQENNENCFVDCKDQKIVENFTCKSGDCSSNIDANIYTQCGLTVESELGYTFNRRYYFSVNNVCLDKEERICPDGWQWTVNGDVCKGITYYNVLPDSSPCAVIKDGQNNTITEFSACLTEGLKWPWVRKPETGCNCNGVCEKGYGEKFSNCPSDCNTCGTNKDDCNKKNQDTHEASKEFTDYINGLEKCQSDFESAKKTCADTAKCSLSTGLIVINPCPPQWDPEKTEYKNCVATAETDHTKCVSPVAEQYFASEEYIRYKRVGDVCNTYGSGCDDWAGENQSNCPQDCGSCGNKVCDTFAKTATSTFFCQKNPLSSEVSQCEFDKSSIECALFPPVVPPGVVQIWNCGDWLKCDTKFNGCTTTFSGYEHGYNCKKDVLAEPAKYDCLQTDIALCPVNNTNCAYIGGESQGNCDDCTCLKNEICDRGENWEKCYDDCHCGDGSCKKNDYQTVSVEVIADPSLAGSVCMNGWYVHGVQDVRPTLDSIYKSQSSDWRYKYYWWVDDATGYEYYCLPDDSGQWGTECINAFNSSVNSKTGKQCCEPGPLCKVNYCDFDRVCDNLQFSTSSAGVKWGGTLGMDKFENPFTCPYDCPCYPSGSGSTWPKGGSACYSYVYPMWEENSKNCPNDCGNELGIITVTSTNVTAHTADLLVRISGLGGAPTGSYWVNYGIQGDTSINAPFPGVKSTNSFATITIPVQDLRGGQTYEFAAQLMVEEQYSPANFKVSGWTLQFTTPKGLCKDFSITAPGVVYPDEATEIKWGKSENCDDHYRILVLDSNGQAYMKFAGNGDTVKEILGSGLDEYKNNIEKNTFQWGADKKARPFEIVIVAYNKEETDYLEERITVNVPEIPVLSSWWAAGSGKCFINGPSINFGFDFSSLLPDGGRGLIIDFKLYSTYELNGKVSEVNGVAGKQTGQINVGYYDDIGNPDPTDPSQPQPADQKYYLTSYLKWHGEEINVPLDSEGHFYKEVILDDHQPPLVGFAWSLDESQNPPLLDLHAFPYPNPPGENSRIKKLTWYYSAQDYNENINGDSVDVSDFTDPLYPLKWWKRGKDQGLLNSGIGLVAEDDVYSCGTSTIPANEFRSVNFREESGI